MKKIIFSTMITSLLAFVGCQNEELVNESSDNSNGKKVTITANIAGATASRVALTDKDAGGNPSFDANGNRIIKVDWRTTGEKEKFTVYNTGYTQSAVYEQIGTSNNFSGEEIDGAYAYYGYNEDRSYDLSSQDGTLNENYVLMKADMRQNTSKITFDHKTAILKVAFKRSVGTFDNTAITQIVMDNVNAGSNNNSITIRREEGKGLNNFYIFLPIESNYYAGHTFNFSVITAGGQDYIGTLTIPQAKSITAGSFYTAKIALQEATYCNLPDGNSFSSALFNKFVRDGGANLRSIKFVAKSTQWTTGILNKFTELNDKVKYRIINGTTLELHTNQDLFKFNSSCFRMFSSTSCSFLANITSIDFNGCINTSNVMYMQHMFDGCTSLQSLDLSSFNTSNVTNMTQMFQSCSALNSLDLSSFNTSNVTNMSNMFYGCYRLQSLNLIGFDFSKVDNFENMFSSIAFKITESIIIVDENGYNLLKNEDTGIGNNVEYVKPDGTPWLQPQ